MFSENSLTFSIELASILSLLYANEDIFII
jgi:hypothetical protein